MKIQKTIKLDKTKVELLRDQYTDKSFTQILKLDILALKNSFSRYVNGFRVNGGDKPKIFKINK